MAASGRPAGGWRRCASPLRPPARSGCLQAEHFLSQRLPFLLQRYGRRFTPGAAVPAAGVAHVAFLAVQIGMHDGACFALILLRTVMGPVPVALGVPPQCLQCEARSLRWRILRE